MYSSLRVLLPPKAKPLLQSSRLAQTWAPPRCAGQPRQPVHRARAEGERVALEVVDRHRDLLGRRWVAGRSRRQVSSRGARVCQVSWETSAAASRSPASQRSMSRACSATDPRPESDAEPQPLHPPQHRRELVEDCRERGVARRRDRYAVQLVVGVERRFGVAGLQRRLEARVRVAHARRGRRPSAGPPRRARRAGASGPRPPGRHEPPGCRARRPWSSGPGSEATSPACWRRSSASRTGVRLTPSQAASSWSRSCSPGREGAVDDRVAHPAVDVVAQQGTR